MDAQDDVHEGVTEVTYTRMVHPGFSITRQEILTLTRNFERIPQAYMVGGEIDPNQPLPLMMVDKTSPPPILATSSQDNSAQAAFEGVPSSSQVPRRRLKILNPLLPSKTLADRWWPRYSALL